jgi:hypothetical protein
MNFHDLRNQQNLVIQETHDIMPGVNEHIGIGISALLATLYETAKLSDVSTESGVVQSYAWLWMYKSVFTIAASLTCAESGFYNESLSLNRSLCESLVQILYLRRHPSDVAKLPSTANGRKRKLSFFSMFEEIAPGYYHTSYNFSSEFVHPGLGGNIYKLKRDELGNGQLDQGVLFKPDPLSHCFNELSMLILGYLRCVPLTYQSLKMKDATAKEWAAAVSSMQSVIDSHIKLKSGPNEWHRLSKPLWSPE